MDEQNKLNDGLEAVYEDGVLKPLVALNLPNNSRWQLRVNVAEASSSLSDEARGETAPPQYRTRLNPLAVQSRFFYGVLIAAILVGGLMRLSHLNWDQNAHYHPDERWITMVTGSMKLPASVSQFLAPKFSPLNPYYDSVEHRQRNFAYGTLPVYLTSITAWLLSFINPKWAGYDYLPIIGRALSGLLDTGAILLVFLLGRRLWGEAVGTLGALFYALTVLSIQHSHFYTTDITLNFFILLTIFCSTEIIEKTNYRSGLLTGAAAGLALASKFSAAPILAIIPVVLLLRWFGFRLQSSGKSLSRPSLKQCLVVLLAAGLGFFALNFLFQPYAYLDPQGLISSIKEQNKIIVTGEGEVPYTQQYLHTIPYLYFIDQIARWAMGWTLGLTALAGWVMLIVQAFRRRSTGAILLLAWMIPYFLIVGRFHAKFLRYALPLLPFLALTSSLLLVTIRHRFRAHTRSDVSPIHYAPAILIGLVIFCTAFWAFAFMSIYRAPHSANQAAAWINANVPTSARLLKEHWEEGLSGLNPRFLAPPAVPELPLYEPDDARKLAILAKLLSENDYIVFYSQRLYGTIPRQPERYPMSRRYYELLMSGKLGYELVHFSAAYPHFAGVAFVEDTFTRPDLPMPALLAAYKPAPITINGGFADESFTAYDHPLVLVFKKTRAITAQEIDTALRPYLPPDRR